METESGSPISTAASPTAPRPPRRTFLRTLAEIAAVVSVTVVLVAALRWNGPPIYDVDGWFHIRYAQLLRDEGISRSFPWWQETFLRDHWADKDFLYHVLLIPFTFGNLMLGARLAAVFFAGLALGTFCVVARLLRVPAPAAFSLGLLACSSDFLFRLTFTRPHVLGVALALAGTCAVFLRRPVWAFVLAALYANAHTSFLVLPFAAFLYCAVDRSAPASGRLRRFRLFFWTAAGAALGCAVSPYVPNNLHLWWVQNVRVLGLAWSELPGIRLGTELLPLPSNALLLGNLGIFLALPAATILMARARRVSADATVLILLAWGFLFLAMLSQRFLEFCAPFTVLLAGAALRDRIRRDEAGTAEHAAAPAASHVAGGSGIAPRRAAFAALAALLVVAVLLVINVKEARSAIAEEEGPSYEGAAGWLSSHVPAGETVFHLSWDEVPELFFFAPRLHYLVGLDPTFMYETSASRCRLWSDIAGARRDDLFDPIRGTFGCRFVLAPARFRRFLAAAGRDPRFTPRYEDRAASVFELEDGPPIVEDWRVVGWYPDPARRLLEVPLGPEPGATATPRSTATRAIGPGERGVEVRRQRGFLDLDKVLAIPPLVRDACAVAEATIATDVAAKATLGLTTDDEFRLWVDGRVVLENSPYLAPPAGQPGGPPVDLGHPPAFRERVPERTARISLGAGAHAVLVKTCRVGDDFGFILRRSGF